MISPTDQPYDGSIKSWAKTTCEWASIHGLAWYNHIDNRVTKLATILLAMVSCIGLPLFLSYELVEYSQNYQVLTSGKKIQALFTPLSTNPKWKMSKYCCFDFSINWPKWFIWISQCDNMSSSILYQTEDARYGYELLILNENSKQEGHGPIDLIAKFRTQERKQLKVNNQLTSPKIITSHA